LSVSARAKQSLGASELELWKAVGGMMTADPALVPEARVIERLSFEDALAFALHGAEVLHPHALAPARRAGVAVRFLDVHAPRAFGTVLEAQPPSNGAVGIASRRRLVRVSLRAGDAGSGAERLADLASALARHRVEPAAWTSDDDRVWAYLVPGPSVDLLLAEIGPRAIVEKELALAVLVGRAPADPGLAARGLEALSRAGVHAVEAVLGQGRASHLFVVHERDLERAVREMHAILLAPEGARIP
jgi:aspartate kinase